MSWQGRDLHARTAVYSNNAGNVAHLHLRYVCSTKLRSTDHIHQMTELIPDFLQSLLISSLREGPVTKPWRYKVDLKLFSLHSCWRNISRFARSSVERRTRTSLSKISNTLQREDRKDAI